jgi:F-type H+-transporting ATPase subunit a
VTGLCLGQLNPLEHVVQHRIWAPHLPWDIPFFDQFTILSNHMIMQVIAAVLVVTLLPRFVRKRAGDDPIGRFVPRGVGNAIEAICGLLREHVARPALGPHTDRFVPYVWSAFFFVLTCNLLGLIPLSDWTRPLGVSGLGGTATGNIGVTAALAICTLGMIIINGLRLQGWGYIRHFFMGPPLLAPMIAVLEVGRADREDVRAGHASLREYDRRPYSAGGSAGPDGMAWAAFGGGLGVRRRRAGCARQRFIYCLELLVAVLQAFIFAFLSATFIGQAVVLHAEHTEHAAEAHADLHATAEHPEKSASEGA